MSGDTKSAASARRREAERDYRRAAIFAAARQVFAERGIDGASLRIIAAAAGYTPGAVYSYYASKEELYADVLRDSLARLARALEETAASASGNAARLRAVAHAALAFYHDNPRDLDLSLYLAQGVGPKGLTPALNRDLNARLVAAVDVIRAALTAARPDLAPEQAQHLVGLLVSTILGVALLAHTRRLATLGCEPPDALDAQLDLVLSHR